MQEGFESLNDPCLSGNWKEWSGALVCVFLTAYVHRRNDDAHTDFARSSLFSLSNVRPLNYIFGYAALHFMLDISTAYVERLSATHAQHKHCKVPTNDECNTPGIIPYHDEPEELPYDVEQPVAPVPVSPSDDHGIYDSLNRRSSRLTLKASRRSSFIGHHRYVVSSCLFCDLTFPTFLRHESPSSHQHKAGPRLAPWHRISTAHLSDENEDDVRSAHSHGHAHDVNQEVSRKTRIISILVCTSVREQLVSVLNGRQDLANGHHAAFNSHWPHTGHH